MTNDPETADWPGNETENQEYPPDPIDSKALMAIACNLPRYDPADDDEAIGVYAPMHAALRKFVGVQRHFARATVGTVRKSLHRLDRALSELQEAWIAADDRTKGRLTDLMGEPPFVAWEAQPQTEAKEPSDAWNRGAYRIAKFREGRERIAEGVDALKQEFDGAEQDRKGPIPGLHELIASLAETFTHCTGRPFSRSTNRDSATNFVTAVIATLPEECRPNRGSVEWAMRETIKAASGE